MTTPEKQIIRRVMDELFSKGRTELIAELYAPSGQDSIRKVVDMLRGGFPDLSITIEHLIQEEDTVACRWKTVGTHQGWFHGVPPTGARATWTGTGLYEVVDGRIVAAYSNWDLYGLLDQLRTAMRG